MFTRLHLENFHSFIDFTIDLVNVKNKGKTLIYGENGAGKSSIIQAFSFLKKSIRSVSQERTPITSNDYNEDEEGSFTQSLINIHKRIGSGNKDMRLVYSFTINGKEGEYELIYSNSSLVYEKLSYQVNRKTIPLFEIKPSEYRIHTELFLDKGIEDSLVFEAKYMFGQHSFLAVLNSLIKGRYIMNKTAFNPEFLSVLDEFSNRTFISEKKDRVKPRLIMLEWGMVSNVYRFSISTRSDYKERIKRTEEELAYYLHKLYRRIEGVQYDIDTLGGKRLIGSLCILEKGFDGKTIKVPIDLASNGVKKTIDFFFYYLCLKRGLTVIVDEFDSDIHDLLAQEFYSFLENTKGQMILTTHNLMLLQSANKWSINILDVKDDGVKVNCIGDWGRKVQAKTNVFANYIKGEFGGKPN